MKNILSTFCALCLALSVAGASVPSGGDLIDGVLEHQIPDGALNMSVGGSAVWINPYFGHIAVCAVLAAVPRFPEKRGKAMRFAGNWFDWYAAHQKANGIIDDYRGSLDGYESTGDHDSTDSYAAMYLVALERFAQAGGEVTAARKRAAEKAFRAMLLTYEPDGLTFAKPTYAAKYLMDNIEVNYGLQSACRLFSAWGKTALAQEAREALARNYAGLQKFILPAEDYFAFALTGKEEDVCHKGFAKYYPDLMVNAFAALAFPEPPKDLWKRIVAKQDEFSHHVCSRAYSAAMRKKDVALADAIRQKSEQRLSQTPSLGAMRLDLLYDSLLIAIDDGMFWPQITK